MYIVLFLKNENRMVKFKENGNFTKVGLSFGTHTILGGLAHGMVPPVVSGGETSCDLFWL